MQSFKPPCAESGLDSWAPARCSTEAESFLKAFQKQDDREKERNTHIHQGPMIAHQRERLRRREERMGRTDVIATHLLLDIETLTMVTPDPAYLSMFPLPTALPPFHALLSAGTTQKQCLLLPQLNCPVFSQLLNLYSIGFSMVPFPSIWYCLLQHGSLMPLLCFLVSLLMPVSPTLLHPPLGQNTSILFSLAVCAQKQKQDGRRSTSRLCEKKLF